MDITVDMIKELRQLTGAGVLDCRNALAEVEGDFDNAEKLLKKQGLAIAAKKAEREAEEGLVEAYIHGGGKLGVLLELNCETDFVARTDDFRELAHDLAMQIAATDPQREQIEGDKPEEVMQRILEGKLKKYYEEVCLLEQPFIKDEDVTIRDLIASKIAKLGENIKVRRYARFELGGE
jgi:elongation factor Ts